MKTILNLAPLLLALSLHAQTKTEIPNAVLIGPEGIVITGVSNPSALLQYGVGTTWDAPVAASALPKNMQAVTGSVLGPTDPLPDVAKTIVAQQTATAYQVTYNDLSGKPQVVKIPALVAPPVVTSPVVTTPVVTPSAPTLLGTFTCTVQMYSDFTFTANSSSCVAVTK